MLQSDRPLPHDAPKHVARATEESSGALSLKGRSFPDVGAGLPPWLSEGTFFGINLLKREIP